ncbi:MAG: proline--tRNA ligase [Chloroflexota bacterium]
MRFSRLFGQTLYQSPAEAQIASHQLLLRAGFIRSLGAGIYSYLHFGRRSFHKIAAIMRDEIDAIGGQELFLPVVHPADLWKETKRWYEIGEEMGRFKDRTGRDMVLAMTHEEVVADLVRREVQSYKQLPCLVYHIQTKWRDDPRPRAGLIRVREFTMLDSYSLDADWEGLEAQYRAHYQAYFNIFGRCDLPVVAVQSDVGMMGGKLAHEFMYLTPMGEDTLIFCGACGYKANRQVAKFSKPHPPQENMLPVEKVATPDVSTIQELAEFLDIPKEKTAKAVFMMATIGGGNSAEERFVFVVVRGDMEVNESKLALALGARELRPATDAEIRGVGAVPGYASPVGVEGAIIAVDDLIPLTPNLVAGSNEEGYHLRNVNYGRDYQADIVADIVSADDGFACHECGEALRMYHGVEVGNIFQLGTRYSDALGCCYTDKEGQHQPVIMGSYGIGVGRLLACVAEEHHDEHGLTWPVTISPYEVHLIALKGGEEKAEQLHGELKQAGIATFFDDRDESAGVKFTDADLIGFPIRVTVSGRSLESGGVEVKLRTAREKEIVPLGDIVPHLHTILEELYKQIGGSLKKQEVL